MVAELERRAADMENGDETPLDYACEWIGSGKTILQLAKDLSYAINKSDDYIRRFMLSGYLNGLEDGPERLEDARRQGAGGLADQSLEVVDEEVSSKEDVSRNRNRADHRLRLAGFWDRATYGESKQAGVNVQLNFGDLHLDALRQRAMPEAAAAPPELGPGEEIAVVEGDDVG